MYGDRLTVAQILPELNSGGVERGTLEVSRELVSRGYRSIVISSGGSMVSQFEDHGAEHVTLPVSKKSPLTFRSAWPLRDALKSLRPDILHARSRVPAWVSVSAMRFLPENQRPHFVTTCHGLYSVNRYSRVMTAGERVIAISETVEDYVLRNYPHVDRSRLVRVYRGVDPNEFPRGYAPTKEWSEAFFREFPICRDRTLITLPGRLTRYKGHPKFLEMMSRLKTEMPDAIGLIVGGRDPRRRRYAEELEQIVRDKSLDNVVFTGNRSDIRDIYAISNVVVSCSIKPPEAFGRTTLEALSLGTPVVGFDQSGPGEILAAMFPEGRVPLGDVDALTETVVSILAGKSEPAPNTLFTLERMLNETVGIYEELAECTAATADERRRSAA